MPRRKRRSAVEYLLIAVLLLVITWLAYLLWGIVEKEEIARQRVDETKRELEMLEKRKTTLAANLAELETSRGEEAALRETYGVARPGEEVIIVVQGDGKDVRSELPWWRAMLGWFGL